jgi:cardiolipin synthase
VHPGAPDGPIAWRVLEALGDVARSGVPVTAQLDAFGSGLVLGRRERRAFVEAMRDSRIDVIERRFSPLRRNALDDARLAVDHRKLFDIDGRVMWGGGINLVDAWSPWHDLMQRVEGPAAAQAGAVLAARWRDLGGEVTPGRVEALRRGLMAPVDDVAHATRLLTDGNRHRRELSEAFVAVAEAAQERFVLMDPYLSDPRAMRAVVSAAGRLGQNAELFLSPKSATGGQAQDVFTDPLRRAWAYRFAEAGGRVHVAERFSHAKGWLADDVAGVGSHNKDRGSMRRAYENLTATNDPTAVTQLETAIDHQRSRGVAADADVVAGWRTLARVRDALGLQY